MTWTYTPATPRDLDRVRFHIGDTDADAPILSDEDIQFQIAEADGDWKAATINCIVHLIAKVAGTPSFSADWLQVDQGSALASWRALLAVKRTELGVPAVTGRGQAVYRSDSSQTKPPSGW